MPEIILEAARLFDETATPFLVVKIPLQSSLTSLQSAKLAEFLVCLPGQVVLATPSSTGQFDFSGPESLMAIARTRIDAQTRWEILPFEEPNQPDPDNPHLID